MQFKQIIPRCFVAHKFFTEPFSVRHFLHGISPHDFNYVLKEKNDKNELVFLKNFI